MFFKYFFENLFSEKWVIYQICPKSVWCAHICMQFQSSCKDRPGTVETTATSERYVRKFIRSHIFRNYTCIVESIILMEPPFSVIKQTSFFLHFFVQRGVGIRHKDIECCKCKFVFYSKIASCFYAFHCITVVSYSKSCPCLKTPFS